MRIFLTLLVGSLPLAAIAQEMQTLDFPDYRSKRDNLSKVTDPGIRNDLIYFTLAGLDQRVGKPMAQSFPITAYGGNFITFASDSVRVTIKATPFVQGKRKLNYIEGHLVRIDNHPYYGDYGLVPQNAIALVQVLIGKDTVAIPAAAYNDLYEPQFAYSDGGEVKSHDGVYRSPDGQTVYVYMLNKETNGYYEVTWVIRNKQYLRRVVDTGI